jgi:hypothetical protein
MFKKSPEVWCSWAVVSVAFFALIACAVYWTRSAMPLWALLLYPGTPTIRTNPEGTSPGKEGRADD